MRIVILEGARGTGKSTLAFKLRQMMSDTTLINFTGFHDDGEQGLKKVTEYYDAWMSLFFNIYSHDSNYVFDRFFFTEMVFSRLYKDYSFKTEYFNLVDKLSDLAYFGVKIDIVYLTINDENELKQRLIREKVPFGNAEESVIESLKQQDLYNKTFHSLHYIKNSDNTRIHTIDTSGKSIDNVYMEIAEKLKTT